MKNATFLSKHRAKFIAGLERKTGWGKNEVAQLFDQTAAEAAAECLDEGLRAGGLCRSIAGGCPALVA